MSGSGTPAAGAQVTAEQVMQEFAEMRSELARQHEENSRLKAEQGAALEQVRAESAAQVAELQAQAQQAELVDAMAKREPPSEKLQLVDTKGLGKPTTFSGEHDQSWTRRSDGEKAPDADRVHRLQEKSRELASALQMVTSKEPFTIVCNCQTNGFEAWTRLTRQYDPAIASRKRTMLRAIISPQLQKLENPPQAIEEWADRRATIADEIRMAALEAMLTQDPESHIQLNQSRFSTYDDVLDEVTHFIEYKTGKSLKVISAAAASAASKDGCMELSYVDKAKERESRPATLAAGLGILPGTAGTVEAKARSRRAHPKARKRREKKLEEERQEEEDLAEDAAAAAAKDEKKEEEEEKQEQENKRDLRHRTQLSSSSRMSKKYTGAVLRAMNRQSQADASSSVSQDVHTQGLRFALGPREALAGLKGSVLHQDAFLNEDIRGPPTSQSRAMSLQESFRQSNSPGQEACSPSRYFEDTYPSSPRDAEFERQAAPPSTGRQSQELLREMRRLRQQMEQMAELEKLAAGRDPGLPTDKLGAMSSLSMSSGSRPSVYNNAQGLAASPMADRPGPSARGVFRPHALSESRLGSTPFPTQDGILSAWEYRPHEDDPVDAAVARLVNRGRYRAWRALLCRLEHEVYLCGTKRVHIRVDEEQGLLEGFTFLACIKGWWKDVGRFERDRDLTKAKAAVGTWAPWPRDVVP
eukprot:s1097_g15.t2